MSLALDFAGVEAESPESPVLRARRLTASFAARAPLHDAEASFAFENFDDLRDAGLLNLTIPRAAGGYGAGPVTVLAVLQAVAEGDPSTALVLAMHYLQHAGIARNANWPSPTRELVVGESLQGVALINAARVEPELGTPARGGLPATTASAVPGGWSITGRKLYTTGAPILRWASVWARTDEPEPRVGAFLVPLDAPGVHTEKTWNHLGMRATGSDDLVLERVQIPQDFAVDVRPLDAWKGGDAQAGLGSLAVAVVYHGVAVAARRWLLPYLASRVPSNLGAALSTLPRVQTVLGEIESLLMVNDRLVFNLADDLETGRRTPAPVEPGLVKSVVTNNAVRAVKLGLELTGNAGLSRDNPLERHYRDVLCGPVHTPQDDMAFISGGQWSLRQAESAGQSRP